MSDSKQPKLEIQISSPQSLVRRMDQQLELVERLLAEADAAHALLPVNFTNSLGMKMLWCPPGEFLMGSPREEEAYHESQNQVQVQISKGFWMASTPVTQGQWQALMGNNPSGFKGTMDLPVEQVNWFDALRFCAALNTRENLPNDYHYALPTEAQWEYACRAGTATPFHFGNELDGTEANCDGANAYGTDIEGIYLGRTTIVGSYPPNAWGLHDMHGNVWEWCADWYGRHLSGGTDPTGPTTSDPSLKRVQRVQRGGAWDSSADRCRAAYREAFEPDEDEGFSNMGFRPALVPYR